MKIAVILASTRTGRAGAAVAEWILAQAQDRPDAEYTLIDLAEVDLPQIDEPIPPAAGRYSESYTRQWAETVGPFDGYVSTEVTLNLRSDFEGFGGKFTPAEHQAGVLAKFLDQLESWSCAMASVRQVPAASVS